MYYYGYKLHVVCSIKGVVQSFDLSPACVHDIHYFKNVKLQISVIFCTSFYKLSASKFLNWSWVIYLDDGTLNIQKLVKRFYAIFSGCKFTIFLSLIWLLSFLIRYTGDVRGKNSFIVVSLKNNFIYKFCFINLIKRLLLILFSLHVKI